jgi:dextranase
VKKRFAAVIAVVFAAVTWMSACSIQKPDPDVMKIGETGRIAYLNSDRARYEPGKPVQFLLHLKDTSQGDALYVRYSYLSQPLTDETVKLKDGSASWSWTPPKDDYRGYLVDVFVMQSGAYVDHAGIGVDVSSDWGKFPRYGYLADFSDMPAETQKGVIDRLNRLHLNGIQFYDWQAKHHQPLATQDGQLAANWTDIANRTISAETVKRYIDEAHALGMKAMNYNLLFGANRNYEQDGAKKEWGLFKDTLHDEQDHHPLPSSWKSDIFIMDPGNKEWQNYLIAQEKKVFETLPFDGFHVDQLGDRGALWDYNGNMVDLPSSYQSFLQAGKQKLDVDYVMNAVNQFGQQQIAQSPVKFLYTEVWLNEFKDLTDVIGQNSGLSHYEKNTVIAAYMDYDLADGSGQFNAPGVLLTDAAIFAAGGAHIEAGESLLAKEYFPNRNLAVPDSLWKQLQGYYDFLVAYENLLRDGVTEAKPPLEAAGGPQLSEDPEKGKLWTIAREKGNTSIVHLINLTNADSTEWKDAGGTQPEPAMLQNLEYRLQLKEGKKVKRIWLATPDQYSGSPIPLSFTNKDGAVSFAVPYLKYWDMIVIEYQ